jgi:hypothetical protein
MPDRTDAPRRADLSQSVAEALRAIRGAEIERAEARGARLRLAAVHGATRLRRAREGA